MSEVVIATYAHRWGPLMGRLFGSVVKNMGEWPSTFLARVQPGNCHVNMQAVYEKVKALGARYMVLVDEDVQVLDEWWLAHLLGTLRANKDAGVVGCEEVKDGFSLSLHRQGVPIGVDVECDWKEVGWVPAYVMAFDLMRAVGTVILREWLYFDVGMPGDMGMTDVDVCMQVHERKLKVYNCTSTAVYHPHKSPEWERVMGEKQRGWWVEQMQYMKQKWGEAEFLKWYSRRA